MQKSTLYELIGELRDLTGSFRLSKQYIIDFSVEHHSKFLNTRAVREICEILKTDFSDAYSIEDNLDFAIQDYLEKC